MSEPIKTTKNKNKKIKKEEHNKLSNQGQSELKSTEVASSDARFAKAKYDPKFMAPGSKVTKVAVDKRFSKMLKDKSFNSSSKFDRYGRKNNQDTSNNELKEYYYMEGEGQNEDEIEVEEQKQIHKDQSIREWMENYDEQSSELDQLDIEALDAEQNEVWESESENVVKGENVKTTKRLALCNYDWTNINSKDLMILFNSFKPKTGFIKSVKVYMSNIGKEKLQLEQINGPTGIWRDQPVQEEVKKPQWKKTWKELLKQKQEDENIAFDEQKLRQYQKERLKYFYAVIECDSKQTADEIYRQCDGNQFQHSTIQFDLRFIPDDTKFEKTNFKEECNELPQGGEIKNFINRALGHSKVSLSWEDPDLSLSASLKNKNWSNMSQADLEKINWGNYIDDHQIQEDDQRVKLAQENVQEGEGVSDWRKSCNKKYRKDEEDIEITFEGGFDTKNKKNKKVDAQVPSLNKQKKSMKDRKKLRLEGKQKQRAELGLLVDEKEHADFNPDLQDERFPAVYNDPAFVIDPSDPSFNHRRIGKVFAEVVSKNKNKHRE